MAALKDKLSRIKKGAAEPAPSPAAAQPPAVRPVETPPAPKAAGGNRFGGLKNVRVGDFSESGDFSQDRHDGLDDDIPFDALPPGRPASAPPAPACEVPRAASRFGSISSSAARQVANQPNMGHTPAARRTDSDVSELQWDDPARPAGSSYSEQEWLAAEDGGANVVFEMVKPGEVGLCAVPRASFNGALAALYSRSLIVSEDCVNAGQWPRHASIVHRDPVLGDREVITYRIVRAADAIKRDAWLQGTVHRNDLEVAYQESKGQQAEKNRFGNMPRQR